MSAGPADRTAGALRGSPCGCPQERLIGALAIAAVLSGAGEATAQSSLDRSPNLTAGWIGTPGALQLDASVRYRDPQEGDQAALPTLLLGYGLPANLAVGASFAAGSPVAPEESTEVEPFVRWAPVVERAERPLQVAAQLAYNTAAGSLDGEVQAGYRLGPGRLLGALRAFTDGYSEDSGFAVAAGAVLHPLRGVAPIALAGDLGTLIGIDGGEDVVWSAGVQIGLPVSTATLSLQATNATSGTIQGRSLGTGRTRYGLHLTVASPVGVVLGTFVPREVAQRAVQPVESPEGRVVHVAIREFAFVGGRLEVPRGTTVVWTNRDRAVHTATSDDGSWNSGAIAEGESWSARFDEPGTYSYHCGPHPYMRGSVVVR